MRVPAVLRVIPLLVLFSAPIRDVLPALVTPEYVSTRCPKVMRLVLQNSVAINALFDVYERRMSCGEASYTALCSLFQVRTLLRVTSATSYMYVIDCRHHFYNSTVVCTYTNMSRFGCGGLQLE